ncbi:MAG: sulfotransferase [Gammaproteobacteria bacterium]|nr:sulfotransferase [Gammaproteobacteria bacterium]
MKQPPSDKDKQRFKKAMKALEGGKPADAIKIFAKIRKSWCDDADIGYLEGLAYGKLGDLKGVIHVSNRALQLDPDHYGALCNLANAQMGAGDSEAALENYTKAIEIKSDAPEILNNYGRTLSILGRRDEAIEQYEKALQANPNHAPVYCALGKALAESGHPKQAMEKFKRGLELDSNLAEAHVGMGVINCGIGGLESAEFHFNEALRIDKNNCSAYIGLASVKRFSGEYEKGLEYLRKAENINNDNRMTFSGLKVNLLEQMGDKEQAYNIINGLIQENNMNAQAATVFSRLCRKYDRCDEAIDIINNFIESQTTDTTEKQALMYAAGDLLDKLSRYDEAINYYNKANASVEISCDRDTHTKYHDDVIECFSQSALQAMPHANTESSRPVFVLGMPRSGTTLTEQILATHPDVFGAGELDYVKKLENSILSTHLGSKTDYISKISSLNQEKLTAHARTYLDKLNKLDSKARYVIDKMPNNFIQIGLISLLFPNARIIHCLRNPLDNCLSIYFQNFIWSHDYAVNLSDIGFYYNEHNRLMKHWKEVLEIPIMTVQYEDILQDQEAMSRKLLEFCDLEWDESVMKFYDSKRDVGTASYDQVRRPIYQSSKERWRNYEKHIEPLISELNYSGQIIL